MALIIALIAVGSLWSFIRRTNFIVSRFVESVRFEDYSQRFSDPSGGGFDVLGETLDHALKAFRRGTREENAEARFLSAIVDDAPSALLTLDRDGRVEMLNKAARQLFARQPLHRVEDLEASGPELVAATQLPPGTRKITRLILDGVPQKAIFASAQVARLDKPVTVLSILPVQSELGALEVAAQVDLVRVLTHEIMNSLTPVTSLARSGADLVAAAERSGRRSRRGPGRDRDRRPPRRGHSAASSRAIASSRRRRTSIAARSRRSPGRRNPSPGARRRRRREIDARLEVEPHTLNLRPIRSCSRRRVLNLLRNAVRVTAEAANPIVVLGIRRDRHGQFPIEVRDNGPGIPEDRRDDIFLPFYTTHKGGSGVGLSFARQVALAHGGSIAALDSAEGGATLRLIV